MDIYHIFADHHPDVNAHEFAEKMRAFLDGLVDMGRMQSYRLTRAKLGFRSMDLPEFHVMMEFKALQNFFRQHNVSEHSELLCNNSGESLDVYYNKSIPLWSHCQLQDSLKITCVR